MSKMWVFLSCFPVIAAASCGRPPDQPVAVEKLGNMSRVRWYWNVNLDPRPSRQEWLRKAGCGPHGFRWHVLPSQADAVSKDPTSFRWLVPYLRSIQFEPDARAACVVIAPEGSEWQDRGYDNVLLLGANAWTGQHFDRPGTTGVLPTIGKAEGEGGGVSTPKTVGFAARALVREMFQPQVDVQLFMIRDSNINISTGMSLWQLPRKQTRPVLLSFRGVVQSIYPMPWFAR